uniref:Polymerase nucleotidyl transferase domain-containing protein n=1 Tax=Arcella intermedia TaxID=1963864 RepID=A0A6B2L2F0_9EUKA
MQGLHEEMEDFCRYIAPVAPESEGRLLALKDVTTTITSLVTYEDARIEVFGSYRTGLYLPASDLDISVLLPSGGADLIPIYRKFTRSTALYNNIRLIPAKVPIIKLEHRKTQIKIDIAISVDGINSSDIICKYLKEYPQVKPLALVLKQFLFVRSMNEPATGGLGGYSLILMIVSFLQYHEKLYGIADKNLGQLLLLFFQLYGFEFNYFFTGISCKDATYVRKSERGRLDFKHPETLFVEDPNDSGNNVSQSTYKILNIRKAFAFAYNELTKGPRPTLINENEEKRPSYLSRILYLPGTMIQHRKHLERLFPNSEMRPTIIGDLNDYFYLKFNNWSEEGGVVRESAKEVPLSDEEELGSEKDDDDKESSSDSVVIIRSKDTNEEQKKQGSGRNQAKDTLNKKYPKPPKESTKKKKNKKAKKNLEETAPQADKKKNKKKAKEVVLIEDDQECPPKKRTQSEKPRRSPRLAEKLKRKPRMK